jgi:hypothetical protein
MQQTVLSYIVQPVLHNGQARVFDQIHSGHLPFESPCILGGVGEVVSIIAFQAVGQGVFSVLANLDDL